MDIDSGSRGPDRYRLLTPRFLLLSLVFRWHCGAVVEKPAVAAVARIEAGAKEEDFKRAELSLETQPGAALSALVPAIAINCIGLDLMTLARSFEMRCFPGTTQNLGMRSVSEMMIFDWVAERQLIVKKKCLSQHT